MKTITFTVKIWAEFYDHEQIGPKEAARLLCRDINQILAKYDGSTGGAQIIHGPKNLKVTGRPAAGGSKRSQPRRRCRRCRFLSCHASLSSDATRST